MNSCFIELAVLYMHYQNTRGIIILNILNFTEDEFNTTNCTDGDVRLIGGLNEYEGTVEVCLNHIWGSVCRSTSYYDYWGIQEGEVVCGQLGYQRLGLLIEIMYHTNFNVK